VRKLGSGWSVAETKPWKVKTERAQREQSPGTNPKKGASSLKKEAL